MFFKYEKRLMNSTALSESSVWLSISGGCFDFSENRGIWFRFITSRTGSYHCMVLKRDGYRVISSLNLLAMSFKDRLYQEIMLLCKKFIVFGRYVYH